MAQGETRLEVEGLTPDEVAGARTTVELIELLEDYQDYLGEEAVEGMLDAAEEAKAPTVLEMAGNDAAERTYGILSPYIGDELDAETAASIVGAERLRAQHNLAERKEKGGANDPYSIAPGVKITLRPVGLTVFMESAEEEGIEIPDEAFTYDGETSLTTVTLKTGSYSTYGGVHIQPTSEYNDRGDGIAFSQEPSIGLGYTGVVRIDGLTAGETWQNEHLTRSGEPLPDTYPKHNKGEFEKAYGIGNTED